MQTVEEVLAEERSKITFSVDKITQFLYEEKSLADIRELQSLPQIPHDFNLFNRGRVEIMKDSFRKFPQIYNALDNPVHTFMVVCSPHQHPGLAHIYMFTKCIQIMGTEEQFQQYQKKCKNFQIIGCYAQTQLAHGSDVKSFLTTATFNPEKDEFIINTPSIQAAKFWPGDLGILATHALVYAELFINGKKHGIHPFIVEIRDKDRNLLAGVEAGDIGPKIGFHSKDNGYLILKNVSVPRQNMLQRFVTVTKKGEFKIKGNPLIGYATMMDIRKYISSGSPRSYASAITIAARYSCFRRQFQNAAKEEIKIIDYQLQQQKIIDRVAEYFTLTLAGNRIRDICDQNILEATKNNNFSLMQQTHICLCLGKAFSSQIVYNGMQICRKACGGHGFSHYSGFPALINDYAAHLTHEGENTVLYLQVGNYLMKNYKNFIMKQASLPNSIKYIESYDYLIGKKCQIESYSQWSLDDVRILLAQGVCHLLRLLSEKIMSKPEDLSLQSLINTHLGLKLQRCAILHAAYYNYNCFREAIVMEKNERIKLIAEELCKLFGINIILTHTADLIEGKFISPNQISELKKLKEVVLSRLRPDLIGIVDGFGIPDKFIRSALISGNPYQNYLKLARENDLNKEVMESAKVVGQIKNYIKNPNPKL